MLEVWIMLLCSLLEEFMMVF